MMAHKLPPEYFQNRQEQARIKTLIVEVIPVNIHYYNLVIALSELLAEYTAEAFYHSVYNTKLGTEGDDV